MDPSYRQTMSSHVKFQDTIVYGIDAVSVQKALELQSRLIPERM